jgi:signal transduction histidine kinase
MFKPIVSARAVSLLFEGPQAVPRSYTNDKKVSKMPCDSASNALRFAAECEVRVSAYWAEDAVLEIDVAATGIGSVAEHLPVLFSDFVQMDTRIQRRLRGMGIGLSLARRFALLLDVHAAVQSAVGKGSRFYLRIPSQYSGVSD